VMIFRPDHIVGVGWVPINPVGNINTEIFSCIARNEELALPNLASIRRQNLAGKRFHTDTPNAPS